MLTLNFNFTIDNHPQLLHINTLIERKENIISFALEYKFEIIIENSVCISIQKNEKGFVYVFEFEDMNDAINFEQNSKCTVLNSTNFKKPSELEAEIVEYAEVYLKQDGCKKKLRKKLIEDKNGFKRYI